jgi:hypothetical protein
VFGLSLPLSFHPMSSGSQGWGGWCHHHPSPLVPRPWHSTYNPPHKQLLVRLGVGGVALFVVLPHSHFPVISLSSSIAPHNPPYEQLLVGVGWVPCRLAVGFCPPSLTPAAVANRTHHPSYEQLLIGMGVGAVVLGVVVVVLPHCWHCRHSTHIPPHEQLLMRLGVGGVVSFIILLPLVGAICRHHCHSQPLHLILYMKGC